MLKTKLTELLGIRMFVVPRIATLPLYTNRFSTIIDLWSREECNGSSACEPLT